MRIGSAFSPVRNFFDDLFMYVTMGLAVVGFISIVLGVIFFIKRPIGKSAVVLKTPEEYARSVISTYYGFTDETNRLDKENCKIITQDVRVFDDNREKRSAEVLFVHYELKKENYDFMAHNQTFDAFLFLEDGGVTNVFHQNDDMYNSYVKAGFQRVGFTTYLAIGMVSGSGSFLDFDLYEWDRDLPGFTNSVYRVEEQAHCSFSLNNPVLDFGGDQSLLEFNGEEIASVPDVPEIRKYYVDGNRVRHVITIDPPTFDGNWVNLRLKGKEGPDGERHSAPLYIGAHDWIDIYRHPDVLGVDEKSGLPVAMWDGREDMFCEGDLCWSRSVKHRIEPASSSGQGSITTRGVIFLPESFVFNIVVTNSIRECVDE